jgi:hypothetical protein
VNIGIAVALDSRELLRHVDADRPQDGRGGERRGARALAPSTALDKSFVVEGCGNWIRRARAERGASPDELDHGFDRAFGIVNFSGRRTVGHLRQNDLRD